MADDLTAALARLAAWAEPRLRADPELAAAYRAAHEDYLARRDAVEVLPGFPSAGGMPTRVKCLHALVAHALAAGPGVNPFGDEALAKLPEWWRKGPCVRLEPEEPEDPEEPGAAEDTPGQGARHADDEGATA